MRSWIYLLGVAFIVVALLHVGFDLHDNPPSAPPACEEHCKPGIPLWVIITVISG